MVYLCVILFKYYITVFIMTGHDFIILKLVLCFFNHFVYFILISFLLISESFFLSPLPPAFYY